MIGVFFQIGMRAPGRQFGFRRAAIAWALFVGLLVTLEVEGVVGLTAVAQMLLIGGIVAGASLIGWRLTQLPKSQSLEFLLASPVEPRGLFLSEAIVGICRMTLVLSAGVPCLTLMLIFGRAELPDMIPLLLAPWVWAVVTGIGLTTWAYESRRVRRVGEIVALAGILAYLVVGVLIGEKIVAWLATLPTGLAQLSLRVIVGMHEWNPFAVQDVWFNPRFHPMVALERIASVALFGVALAIVFTVRSAWRLKGHFHDRHYRPLVDVTPTSPLGSSDAPLTWWAVHRVMEYSGRLNLYLAGGFGAVYAAYLLAGPRWPDCLGQMVFVIVEQAGGVAAVTTGLVLLAAVPAAFQYGLWDSTTQDRLRRLELLLLTQLRGRDYWNAAAAAAWRRGRGYFVIAATLWMAALIAGRMTLASLGLVAASGVLLWSLYFMVGFRAFAGGYQSSGLASLMVIGLPTATWLLVRTGWPAVASILPPGSVYLSQMPNWSAGLIIMPVVVGLIVLARSKSAIEECDASLRTWYDRNHGARLID